jgi:hypothetical protein
VKQLANAGLLVRWKGGFALGRPDAAHNGRGPSHNSLLIKQIEQIARRLRVVQPARHFEK